MPLDLNDAPEQRSAGDAPTQRDWEREREELIKFLRRTAYRWVPEVFTQGKIDRVKKELRVADISGRPPRNKGSCVIQLAGEFAGSFNDFGTGEKGGPISTIALHLKVSGLDSIKAAAEVAGRYGYTGSAGIGAKSKRSTGYKAAAEAAEAANLPTRADDERDEQRERNMHEAAFELGRSIPAAGTLAETYFASRCLTLPPTEDLWFGDNCTHRKTNTGKPTLIAVIRLPDGQPTGGIHRIYLKDDGSGHLGKMMLGPVDGGVVMLAPPASDGTLGISEGIETASAAMQLYGVPCWSTLSAGGMRKLGDWLVENPGKMGKLGIKRLIIFADRGEAGESAAADLQAHATAAGLTAEVRLPQGGDDFADDLAKGLGAPVIGVPVEPQPEERQPEPEEQQPPAEIIAPSFAAPISAQDYDELLTMTFARLADAAVGFRLRMAEWEAYEQQPKKPWPMLDFNEPPPEPPAPVAPVFMIPVLQAQERLGNGSIRLPSRMSRWATRS